MSKREDAAQEFVLNSDRDVRCASCGEETLWHSQKDDFISGFDSGFAAAIELLRSEAAQDEHDIHWSQGFVVKHTGWADFLEAQKEKL